MKKHFICRCVSLVCILIALFAYQRVAAERVAMVAEREAQIHEVEEYNEEIRQKMTASEDVRGLYGQDGVFDGVGDGYGGLIQVEVTIRNGYIEEIQVLSHDNEDQAYFSIAENLVDTMVKEQTAEVDVVSGATFSSRGIIAAVSQALEKAK